MNGPDEVGEYDLRIPRSPTGLPVPHDIEACRACGALVAAPDLDQHTWWHLGEWADVKPVSIKEGTT